jgi:predicted  nucleic acid-binding Zn-ribbon protein
MKRICTECGHVGEAVRKDFGNGLSGNVCATCGSEDVFPYETEEEIAEHDAICAAREERR